MATKLQNFLKLLKNNYNIPEENKYGKSLMNQDGMQIYLAETTIKVSMTERCSNYNGLRILENQSNKINQLNYSLSKPFNFIKTFNVWQSGDYNEDWCDMVLSLTPAKNIKEYNLYMTIYKTTNHLGGISKFDIKYEDDGKAINSICVNFIKSYTDLENDKVKKIVDETIAGILLNIKKFYTKKNHKVSLYQYNEEYGWHWVLNISFKNID